MRPDLLAHLYDLALRALAEQERQVAALHGRLTPVLAAGGLGVTVLTPAAFHGDRPAGTIEMVCVGAALLGVATAVLTATYVLLPWPLAFGLGASFVLGFVQRRAITDTEGFYAAMIVALDEHRLEKRPGDQASAVRVHSDAVRNAGRSVWTRRGGGHSVMP